MSIHLASNLDYEGTLPNFDRDQITSPTDETHIWPIGFLVYCQSDGNYYKRVTDGTTESWQLFSSGGGGGGSSDIGDGQLTIKQNNVAICTFTANQSTNSNLNLANVAISGSYNDLTNLPTIPTVSNAKITITRGGSTIGSFNLNQTSTGSVEIGGLTTVKIDGITSDGDKINALCTCSSSSGNQVKVVSAPRSGTLSIESGAHIRVKFNNINGADNPQLNVNDTGAVPIWAAGAAITTGSTKYLLRDVVDFVYVAGTTSYWYLLGAHKNFVGATTTTSGEAGLVPAPAIGDANRVLGGSGDWIDARGDWNQTTATAIDYIKNKPSLATVATTGSYTDLNDLPTIPTKTYTGVYVSTQETQDTLFPFLKVHPTNWDAVCKVKYKIEVEFTYENTTYASFHVVDMLFARSGYANYVAQNAFTSTSYKPIYYHSCMAAKTSNYASTYGHLVGIDFYSYGDSYSRGCTSSRYARNFKISVLETENCNVEFLDNMVTVANSFDGYIAGTTHGSIVKCVGYAQGVYGTGGASDSNTYTSPYSTTAIGTAAKEATCTNFHNIAKTYIPFHSVYGNNATNPTLNINSQGAKPLIVNGDTTGSSTYAFLAGFYLLYYDGTNYYLRTDGKITTQIGRQSRLTTLDRECIQISRGNVGTDQYWFGLNGGDLLKSNAVYVFNNPMTFIDIESYYDIDTTDPSTWGCLETIIYVTASDEGFYLNSLASASDVFYTGDGAPSGYNQGVKYVITCRGPEINIRKTM